MYKNKIFKTHLKHDAYGYNPMHMVNDIYLFLTINTKIKLKHMTRYIKISFSIHIKSSMYIDEIQYTYKPWKLLLMKSIHETKRCILEKPKHKIWNLILWVLCKPSKHKLFETKMV